MDQKSVIVFVATHVKFNPPDYPIYVPLHVGREGKEDLGYIGDNIGENISDLNCLYGELTGLYWMWQNVTDIDYVGLCHYRRYFFDESLTMLSREKIMEYLKEYDVIIPKHMVCEGSYWDHFARAHNIEDMKAVERAIRKLYPEYVTAFQQAMSGNVFYGGNMFIASRELMQEYSRWLFTIFAEASEEIDVSDYDAYHRRVYGFLSEQLLYVYILHHKLKACEKEVGVLEEKAETKLVKENLYQVLLEKGPVAAKEYFESVIESRPDICLPGSDITGILRKMEEILFLQNPEYISSLIDKNENIEKFVKKFEKGVKESK